METLTNQPQQKMTFDQLVQGILQLDTSLRDSTVKAINRMATMRNWLIGAYIVEYEQFGSDRAQYGAHILTNLQSRLKQSGLNITSLKYSRLFYLNYPEIRKCIAKSATVSHQLQKLNVFREKGATVSLFFNDGKRASNQYHTDPGKLISHLSFSHIRELLTIDDPLVRYFYEKECIKNTWSVRELRRQIVTNLHIRIGLTEEKLVLMAKVNANSEKDAAFLQIRDPYTFEFLGLRPHDIGAESNLEDAIILHLQEFILELGKGFCFESRQKRMIIDDEYYFADLVFYNRLLHCSVIFEIKNDEFRHEHLGQLNAYVGYYKENEMASGDNPPIGVLLCTKKGKKMVEYALGGMDQNLFVSTYQLQLPNREELESFIEQERMEFGND